MKRSRFLLALLLVMATVMMIPHPVWATSSPVGSAVNLMLPSPDGEDEGTNNPSGTYNLCFFVNVDGEDIRSRSNVWFTLEGDDEHYRSEELSPGTQASVHAEEIANCTFTGWYLNDVLVTNQKDFQYTMPERTVGLEARYSTNEGYSWVNIDFSFNEGNGGTVTLPSGQNWAVVETGTKVTLTATPRNGSSFLGWTLDYRGEPIDYLSTDATCEYTVSESSTVYAVFGKGSYTYAFHAFYVDNDGNNVMIDNGMNNATCFVQPEGGFVMEELVWDEGIYDIVPNGKKYTLQNSTVTAEDCIPHYARFTNLQLQKGYICDGWYTKVNEEFIYSTNNLSFGNILGDYNYYCKLIVVEEVSQGVPHSLEGIPSGESRTYQFTPTESGSYNLYAQGNWGFNLQLDGKNVDYVWDYDMEQELNLGDDYFCNVANLEAGKVYEIYITNNSEEAAGEECTLNIVKRATAWAPTYYVQVNSTIGNKTVNLDAYFMQNGNDNQHHSEYLPAGTELTLHAVEIENCAFGWYKDGVLVSNQYETSFTMPEGVARLEARYTPLEGYGSVVVVPITEEGEGGTATLSSGSFFAVAENGTDVTLTATPRNGASFLGWTLDLETEPIDYLSTDATCAYTIDGNSTVYAVFGKGSYAYAFHAFYVDNDGNNVMIENGVNNATCFVQPEGGIVLEEIQYDGDTDSYVPSGTYHTLNNGALAAEGYIEEIIRFTNLQLQKGYTFDGWYTKKDEEFDDCSTDLSFDDYLNDYYSDYYCKLIVVEEVSQDVPHSLAGIPSEESRTYLFTPTVSGSHTLYGQGYLGLEIRLDGEYVNRILDYDMAQELDLVGDYFCYVANLEAGKTYDVLITNDSDEATGEECTLNIMKRATEWVPINDLEVAALVDGSTIEGGPGCWFTLDDDDNTYPAFQIAAGTEVTLHAEEVENCTFNGWYLNEEQISDQYETSFTMPESEAYPYAQYSIPEGYSWVVIYQDNVGGSGTATLTSGKTFTVTETGTKVTLTAEPDNGASFLGWTLDPYTEEIDYLSTDATYEYTVSGSAYICAIFSEGEYLPELYGFNYGSNGYYADIEVTGTNDDGEILATAIVTEPLSKEGCPVTNISSANYSDRSVTYGDNQLKVTLTSASGKEVVYLVTCIRKAIVNAYSDTNMGCITVGDSEEETSGTTLYPEVGAKVKLTATSLNEDEYEFRGWWYTTNFSAEGANKLYSNEPTIEVTAKGKIWLHAKFGYKKYWKISAPYYAEVYAGNQKIEMAGTNHWLVDKDAKDVKIVAHPYTSEDDDPSLEHVFNGWYSTNYLTLLCRTEEYPLTLTDDVDLDYEYSDLTKDIDGSYYTENTFFYGEPYNTPVDFVSNHVAIYRYFIPATPSTIMFPFDAYVSQFTNASIYTFGGTTVNEETNKVEIVMKKVEGEGAMVNAYQPYVAILDDETSIAINGAVTVKKTEGAELSVKDTETGWTFKALGNYKVWKEGDPEIGKAYALAGKALNDVAEGQMVRLAPGASGEWARCYMLKDNASWGQPNKAPARVAAGEELPRTITVRFVSQETTGIGAIDAETGEFTIEGWYDLQGRRINEPRHGQICVKDGKKVIVK